MELVVNIGHVNLHISKSESTSSMVKWPAEPLFDGKCGSRVISFPQFDFNMSCTARLSEGVVSI